MQRTFYVSTIIIAFTLINRASNADVFNNLDEWLAAVPPVTVIDFTDYPPSTLITDQYSDLGITFEPHNNIASFIINSESYIADGFGLANNSGRIIMQFDAPLTIIGSLFPGIQRYEFYLDGEFIGGTNFQGCFDDVGCFAGIILDTPFDEVHVIGTASSVSIDNLYFTFDPIPAPGALALLGLAALCGGSRRRRCM